MLTIPVVYDDATKRIAVSEEWAGTIIDDRSTMFSVSGIPSDAVSAKLDVKVAIRQSNKKTIRPFLILNGIESGTGTAVVPQELFYACKRDLKFIFQLEIMTEEETYASENWITMKVSPSITRRASQLPLWDQDKVLVDCYEVENSKIVFKRFSGEEFSILISDNPVEWESIKNIPWRTAWSTGTPTDKDILCESLVKGELDTKTDIKKPIPTWDSAYKYAIDSVVIRNGTVYRSLSNTNQGMEPTSHPEKWEIVNVKYRNAWTEGTPTDKEVLVESFIHAQLDTKTDKLAAIPEWDIEETYPKYATVIKDHGLYQSLQNGNKGQNPLTHVEWWIKVSGSGSGGETFTTTIGDGTTRSFNIVHNLNTKFYVINIIDAVTGHNMRADVATVDPNTVNIMFTTAPAANGINVVICGGTGGGGGYSGRTVRQETPSDVWTVSHYLGRHVIVQTFDDSWNEIQGEIKQTSDNDLTITFAPDTPTGYVILI